MGVGNQDRREKLWLPDGIRNIVEGKEYRENHVGMSASRVFLFDDMVLKIQAYSGETDNEYMVCNWLSGRIPVPRILAYEVHDEKAYLLMTRMPGKMACDERYMRDPKLLLEIVAEALHLLWGVDASDCPCDNSLDGKLKAARYRVEKGLVDVEDTEPETFGENGFASPGKLLEWLENNRPEEELVFTHGDLSLPNILVQNDRVSGFIDLGRMGIADRWQDIAICYRSLKHNFEGKYNGGFPYEGYSPEMLFEKLGIAVNPDKLNYYILLDELF